MTSHPKLHYRPLPHGIEFIFLENVNNILRVLTSLLRRLGLVNDGRNDSLEDFWVELSETSNSDAKGIDDVGFAQFAKSLRPLREWNSGVKKTAQPGQDYSH